LGNEAPSFKIRKGIATRKIRKGERKRKSRKRRNLKGWEQQKRKGIGKGREQKE
jgi:hypothetical protein